MLSGGVNRPLPTTRDDFPSTRVTVYDCCVFCRNATGAWFYHGAHGGAEGPHQHYPDPARADRIARAFAAFGRTRVERDFPLGRDGAAYGVSAPELVILVYRPGQSQPLVQYAVGHLAPDTVSRYVTVVGHPVVVTIPVVAIVLVFQRRIVAGLTSGAVKG